MSLEWHKKNTSSIGKPYERIIPPWIGNRHIATYADMVDTSIMYSTYSSLDGGYILAKNNPYLLPEPVCVVFSMSELMQVLPTFLYAQYPKATFFEVPKLQDSDYGPCLDFRHMQIYFQAHNERGFYLDHHGFITKESKAWVTPHKSYLTALISTLKNPENYFITQHTFEEGMLPIKLDSPTYIPEMNAINAAWAAPVT